MSTEITKKRGRPKKSAFIASAVEQVEVPETKTASVRQKSTKAIASTVLRKTESVAAVKPPKKPITSISPSVKQALVASARSTLQPLSKSSPQTPQTAKKIPSPPPLTSNSKILKEVFQKHASTPPSTNSQQPLTQKTLLPPTPPQQPHPPGITPIALNAFAISQLSHRPSHPRPKVDDGKLAEKYKPAARRITYALVALPIAIVTSWVLYQRLVLGQERKRLIRKPDDE